MKRVHLYVNRKGELTRLVLWDDLRFKSIITGLTSDHLCQAELDEQPEGEVIILSDDLMSGEKIRFSNRRPMAKVQRHHVCKNCYGIGKVDIGYYVLGRNVFMRCDCCNGRGYLVNEEYD